MEIDFNRTFNDDRRQEFADHIEEMSGRIGFKVSARGWGYLLEQAGYINKDQFDKVALVINDCRKKGFLPVDFVAEEDSRAFSGIETPSVESGNRTTVKSVLQWMCEDVLTGHRYYTPDWWDGEQFYVQMLVEKIDLKTLFGPVAHRYHIPIANAKGWSSILQRAEYARRFKEAEQRGLKCVLLYCGDHDPDGLRIADTIRKNLEQVQPVTWEDGTEGYDPRDLIIERFGLTYDFIRKQGYTWIDNLITGSGEDLASPRHKNHKLPYVQSYLKKIGARKCEANAIVTTPRVARDLVESAITDIIGTGAARRFQRKTDAVKRRYAELLEESGLSDAINAVIDSDDEDDDL